MEQQRLIELYSKRTKSMMNFKCQLVIIPAIFCMLICFSGFNPVSAQTTAPEKKWKFLTDVYLMFPNMNGETGVGNRITVPVDANPGDIFSKLKIAGMIYFEAHNARWAITSDIIYMNLNQEATPGKLIYSGTVSAKQFAWEPAALYRLASFLEVGAGGRLNNIQAGIDVRRNVLPAGTEEVTGSGSKTWFDPILIVRTATDIRNKWLFQFRGDIGGFGVGSDFAWQLQAYAGYRFSKLFQLTGGYRIIAMDYDKGLDAERFVYKVDTFGPVIRMGFNF
jgi:hypothetical protein